MAKRQSMLTNNMTRHAVRQHGLPEGGRWSICIDHLSNLHHDGCKGRTSQDHHYAGFKQLLPRLLPWLLQLAWWRHGRIRWLKFMKCTFRNCVNPGSRHWMRWKRFKFLSELDAMPFSHLSQTDAWMSEKHLTLCHLQQQTTILFAGQKLGFCAFF